jgi:Uma2 family endonuclease
MVAEPIFDDRGEYDENWRLPERLTLAQYSRVVFRPDAHFVDGQIIPRKLGDYTHSSAIGSLIGGLHTQCESFGASCCISLRLQTSLTRIRVCDFVVLAPGAPYEQVPTVPPLLCIEVLGLGQTPEEELPTLADYLAMGVPHIWLIDPVRRSAHTFDAPGLHDADPTHLTVPGTPIHLDLSEAFSVID